MFATVLRPAAVRDAVVGVVSSRSLCLECHVDGPLEVTLVHHAGRSPSGPDVRRLVEACARAELVEELAGADISSDLV